MDSIPAPSPTDGPPNEILTASLQDTQTILLLRNKLKPLLPYSLPLFRRCQFYLHEKSHAIERPDTSRRTKPEIWMAILQSARKQSLTPNDWLNDWLREASVQSSQQAQTNDQAHWIATYINITEPGQTQVWLFSSWEPSAMVSYKSPQNATTTTTVTSTHILPVQYELFQRFYHHLRKNHIPHAPLTPSKQWLNLKESGKILSTPYVRSKVLFGTLSEVNWWMHDDWVVKGQGIPREKLQATTTEPTNEPPTVIAREDRPYLKYVLTLSKQQLQLQQNQPSPNPSSSSTTATTTAPLPPNMSFSTLTDKHLQTMLDRSVIPRTLELLQTLITTGIFVDDSPDPVAWGIIGKDGSLSSLHTEPEYRGRRLAEVVSRELCRRMGEKFVDDDDEEGVLWMHTDVSTENAASQRVFEKMGARVGWQVGWVEVDVGED